MKIDHIRQVVNSSLPEPVMRSVILSVIAEDKNAIPDILEILNSERKQNKELLLETNAELSRALLTLIDPNLGKKKPKPYIELAFVVNEIKKHYIKWKDKIKCNFKIEGLP